MYLNVSCERLKQSPTDLYLIYLTAGNGNIQVHESSRLRIVR